MDYPIEILPNPAYKLIECDLSDHFLIRHIDIEEGESIIDPETNLIFRKYICSQSDHIHDLSTSLLGIFKADNIHIAFTREGGTKFFHYCKPNEIVDVPVYETEFFRKEARTFWCASVNNLHNREFVYNVGAEQLVATCVVMHTPTKWNYWHFSLRWKTNVGSLDDLEEKQRRSVAKKIGHSAIVAICQFAKIDLPESPELSNGCYRNN